METGEIVQIDPDSDDVKINSGELETEYQFIPVQLIQSSSRVGSISPKGKYYKQTYRPAWEHMPDFKGWLRGVEGEPTRAYCTYCHKTLHAHRLSLLKHTCTIRHQKAAQVHSARKSKLLTMDHKGIQAEAKEEVSNHGDTEMENDDEDDDDEEEEDDDDEGDEEDATNDGIQISNEISEDAKEKDSQPAAKPTTGAKPPISTQVTDMTKGKPISGLQVSLYKLIDGRWTFINEGLTNTLGRFSQFIDRDDFTTGRYKLHYDVDRYFEAKKQDTIYPFIEIVFDAGQYTDSHHIPLLLSPFGYTTYRGC